MRAAAGRPRRGRRAARTAAAPWGPAAGAAPGASWGRPRRCTLWAAGGSAWRAARRPSTATRRRLGRRRTTSAPRSCGAATRSWTWRCPGRATDCWPGRALSGLDTHGCWLGGKQRMDLRASSSHSRRHMHMGPRALQHTPEPRATSPAELPGTRAAFFLRDLCAPQKHAASAPTASRTSQQRVSDRAVRREATGAMQLSGAAAASARADAAASGWRARRCACVHARRARGAPGPPWRLPPGPRGEGCRLAGRCGGAARAPRAAAQHFGDPAQPAGAGRRAALPGGAGPVVDVEPALPSDGMLTPGAPAGGPGRPPSPLQQLAMLLLRLLRRAARTLQGFLGLPGALQGRCGPGHGPPAASTGARGACALGAWLRVRSRAEGLFRPQACCGAGAAVRRGAGRGGGRAPGRGRPAARAAAGGGVL